MKKLAEFHERQSAQARPQQVVVDVTGLPKILMAHVLLICLASRISSQPQLRARDPM